MKGNRKFAILCICIFSMSFVFSQGQTEISNSLDNERTVTDCFDRQVILPQSIERIACLYAFTAHVVTMLGEDDKIVAVVNGSKRDMLLNEVSPYIDKAATPSDSGIINIEELLAADPDLVFLKGETALLKEETAKLDLFHIPYVVIDFTDISEQMKAIQVIGDVLNRSERAGQYNQYYQQVIDGVSERTSALDENSKLRVYHAVNEATRTDAAGTLTAEWTQIAGAINVSVGSDLRVYENKFFASIEQILLWDPEVIICNEYGVDKYIMKNEKWQTIEAVKTQRVFKIPTGISRWGHPGGMETPLAIQWTVKTLYPEICSDIDLNQITRNYYADFFDYQISDELLTKVLSGDRMRMPKKDL